MFLARILVATVALCACDDSEPVLAPTTFGATIGADGIYATWSLPRPDLVSRQELLLGTSPVGLMPMVDVPRDQVTAQLPLSPFGGTVFVALRVTGEGGDQALSTIVTVTQPASTLLRYDTIGVGAIDLGWDIPPGADEAVWWRRYDDERDAMDLVFDPRTFMRDVTPVALTPSTLRVTRPPVDEPAIVLALEFLSAGRTMGLSNVVLIDPAFLPAQLSVVPRRDAVDVRWTPIDGQVVTLRYGGVPVSGIDQVAGSVSFAASNGVVQSLGITTTDAVSSTAEHVVPHIGARNPLRMTGDGTTCSFDGDHVECAGRNINGLLGRGALEPTGPTVPVRGFAPVVGLDGTGRLEGVISVAVNATTGFAVLDDGTVAYWGTDAQQNVPVGQPRRALPTPRLLRNGDGTLVTGISSVAAFGEVACFRRLDLTAACLGMNRDGELGRGTTAPATDLYAEYLAPVRTADDQVLPNIGQLAVGRHGACAFSGASVYCWGNNAVGLGTGIDPTTTPLLPYATPITDGVGAPVFADLIFADDGPCGVTVSGSVLCASPITGVFEQRSSSQSATMIGNLLGELYMVTTGGALQIVGSPSTVAILGLVDLPVRGFGAHCVIDNVGRVLCPDPNTPASDLAPVGFLP